MTCRPLISCRTVPTVLNDRAYREGRRWSRSAAFEPRRSIIDRFSFRALALVYFIAVFAVARAASRPLPVFVTMAIFAPAFGPLSGGQCRQALAAGLNPTSVRATGSAGPLGIGRVGSSVGPLVGGVADRKWSPGSSSCGGWRRSVRVGGGVFPEPARRHGGKRPGCRPTAGHV